eukprot:CAMPEP_0176284528 /NCGR_PEP_ID=MMETSP0121_2-20121125/51897_1 /TAXON_ID=160619 /ORGANISM="Kryptoperidinium foliaceum, Strain CCMP 1326" /LENGTH=59 /DNA_ID=CAMNT_0017624977 /DNA_START=29 /DNA_END=206 /DNA_ORIENTATION=-
MSCHTPLRVLGARIRRTLALVVDLQGTLGALIRMSGRTESLRATINSEGSGGQLSWALV